MSPVSIVASVWRLRSGRALAWRAWLAASFLIAPVALPALAYASPPDPAWIHGFYDDADFDDVVWLAVTGTGDVAPAAPVVAAHVALAPERPAPSITRAIPAPPRTAACPRAPPGARLSDV